MPVYEYQCVDCGVLDQRIGAIDDHTAICALCGSLMLRLDEDLSQPYFDNREDLQEFGTLVEDGECFAEKRTGGHADGEPVLLRAADPRAVGAGAAAPPAVFPKY